MATLMTSKLESTFQNDANSMNSASPANSSTMDYQNGGENCNSQEQLQKKPVENVPKIDIPRISSRDLLLPHRPHSPYQEMEQFGIMLNSNGSKREANNIAALAAMAPASKIRALELDECVKRAKKYALEQSVRFVLVKQQQQQQKQQLELIKKQQALLLMCRIYVGSIFYEVKEETVRMAFSPFGPIRSISMSWDAATNKHKGFAFIEFETPEAAQLSLEQMNSVLLGGRNIKVGRPSNMPQAQPIIDQLTEEAKNYNRIYVSSIHQDLLEQDVQSVFEAFGTIKSCQLVRDSATGKHKGYGFIEYENTQAAHDAIASMNLFDLGGQFLRVGKAVTPPEGLTQQPPVANQLPQATSLAAASITVKLQAQDAESTVTYNNNNNTTSASSTPTYEMPIQQKSPVQSSSQSRQIETVQYQIVAPQQPTTQQTQQQSIQQQQEISPMKQVELTENQKKILGMTSADDPSASLEQQVELTLKGKEQRLLLMQKLMQRKPESKVIVLRNMVGPEDVDEYLESEITEECGKYGDVIQVIIYNERQSEDEDAEIIVKIFVEFKSTSSAQSAITALNGRYFAGRIVKAEIYDQTAFNSKDYSG